MSKKTYIKRDAKRPPVHPGKILGSTVFPELEKTLGKSIADIAKDLEVSRQSLYSLISEKRSMSPEMAVKIGHYLGNGPGLWIRMQASYDIWYAEKKTDVSKIPTVEAA